MVEWEHCKYSRSYHIPNQSLEEYLLAPNKKKVQEALLLHHDNDPLLEFEHAVRAHCALNKAKMGQKEDRSCWPLLHKLVVPSHRKLWAKLYLATELQNRCIVDLKQRRLLECA